MQVVINEPSICRLPIVVSLAAKCPQCGKPLDIVTVEGSTDASAICHSCKRQEVLLGMSAAELHNRVFEHLARNKFSQ
jgi:hypothetical protein